MPGIGDPAPNISGNDIINGVSFDLFPDHEGKVIMLSFIWRSCGPCNAEVPRLQSIWNDVAGHGVQVVAVTVEGTEAENAAWLNSLGVTFPALVDTGMWADYCPPSSPDYGYVPHNYVIDRDGIIRFDHVGGLDEAALRGAIMDVVYMRDPIDLEMVMDVSDSMNSLVSGGDSKLVMMKQAATMVTDFLKDHGQTDDRMGLVWFSDDVSEYQNLSGEKLLPIQANWSDLRLQINNHTTGMYTAMGAGLQTAFDTLSTSSHDKFVILCTDGIQNIEPKVASVGGHFEITDSGGWVAGSHSSVPAHPGVDITSYNTRIHTIGIGITATYASLLQDIANATDGFYRGTNDPEIDLDLIYFLDLCNCMAGGSPAVVHHNAGKLNEGEDEVTEYFYINNSIRKLTVMLTWKESQGGALAFWLYSPDGSLIHLGQEMKCYENHCLATIYLPRLREGKKLPYIGQWKMIIKGETLAGGADYHAFVIGEDPDVHYHIEVPKKRFEIGDILPIKVLLTNLQKPILEVQDIKLETSHLRIPLPELLAREEVANYVPNLAPVSAKSASEDPLALKIKAISENPVLKDMFQTVRRKFSIMQNSLECKITYDHIVVPVLLQQPGLVSYKVTVNCGNQQTGPIYRTDMISVYVGAGTADPRQSKVSLVSLSDKGGALIYATPKNKSGCLLGPGLANEFKVFSAKNAVECKIEDKFNGTYLIEVPELSEGNAKASISISLKQKTLWKGEV